MRSGGKLGGRGHQEPAAPAQMSRAPEARCCGPRPCRGPGTAWWAGSAHAVPTSPGHSPRPELCDLLGLARGLAGTLFGVASGMCAGLGSGDLASASRLPGHGTFVLRTGQNTEEQLGFHDPHGGREQGDPLRFGEGILERGTFWLGHAGPGEQRAPGILPGCLKGPFWSSLCRCVCLSSCGTSICSILTRHGKLS